MADSDKDTRPGPWPGGARRRVPGQRHGLGRDRGRPHPAERPPAAAHVRRRGARRACRVDPRDGARAADRRPRHRRRLRDRGRRAPLARGPSGGARDDPRHRASGRRARGAHPGARRERGPRGSERRSSWPGHTPSSPTSSTCPRPRSPAGSAAAGPAIANTMRLLELPDDALALVAAGELSEGHGRALLLASGQDERLALARRADRPWLVGARHRGRGARHRPRSPEAGPPRPGRWTRSSRTWPSTPPGSRSACAHPFGRGRVAAGSRSTSRHPPSSAGSWINSAPSGSPGLTEPVVSCRRSRAISSVG